MEVSCYAARAGARRGYSGTRARPANGGRWDSGACARHNARAVGESLALARHLGGKAARPARSRSAARPDRRARQGRRSAARGRTPAQGREQQDRATLARVARAFTRSFIEPRMPLKLSADWINSLENQVPRALWHKPIAEITRAELLEFLRAMQGRMADTAQRVRRRLDEVFEEAIEDGTVSVNLVAMLRTKLRREHKPKRLSRRMRRSHSLRLGLSCKRWARSRGLRRAAWNSRSHRGAHRREYRREVVGIRRRAMDLSGRANEGRGAAYGPPFRAGACGSRRNARARARRSCSRRSWTRRAVAAGALARLVALRAPAGPDPARGMAICGPEPRQPTGNSATQPCHSRRGRGGAHRQARLDAYPAPLFRVRKYSESEAPACSRGDWLAKFARHSFITSHALWRDWR